jgi:hypothetical protein
VNSPLTIAASRMLSLADVGLTEQSQPQQVRECCDQLALQLARQYLAGELTWVEADRIANHLYELMILHATEGVPEYAWDVFLAFDEGEIDDAGDAFTRPRVLSLQSKYGVA